MATGDILRVDCRFNIGRQPAAFGLHYRIDNSGVVATDNATRALASLIAQSELANIHFDLGSDLTFEGFLTRFVSGADPMPKWWIQALDSNGQRAGTCLPQMKACVITLNQASLPAKNNGRVFVPGIAESDCDGSTITFQNVINSLRDRFNDVRIVSGNFDGVDWAFQHVVLGAGNPGAQTVSPVTSVVVRAQLGSQRRRRTREWGTIPVG